MIAVESLNDQQNFVNSDIANFLPIACHYNQSTLLTKNGELIQIIEIQGYVDSSNIMFADALRENIRKALSHDIPTEKISIYMHVIRREASKKNNLNDIFESPFAELIDKRWTQYNHWEHRLENTLYITVVHQGLKDKMDISRIMSSIHISKFIEKNFTFLDICANDLDNVTNNILSRIEIYHSRILKTYVSKEQEYISEPLSIIYELLHLKEKKIVLDTYDASEQLSDVNIEYNFNDMLIKDYHTKKERFAVLFSLKFPYNLEHTNSDKLLQISIPYILTETLVIAPSSKPNEKFKYYKSMYELGENHDTLVIESGLANILRNTENNRKAFCKQQTTFLLHSDDQIKLDNKVSEFYKICSKIGVVCLREDFNMPRLFFSQIPGNFKLLKRETYNAVSCAASFTMIHHKNLGSYNGSKWGGPISIIKNLDGTQYYFNFHYGDDGNTMIFGPPGSGSRSLIRLLLAQATRLKPRMLIIYTEKDKKDFIKNIGGEIIDMHLDSEPVIQCDIFNIENFNNNFNTLCLTLVQYLLVSLNPNDDLNVIADIIRPWVTEFTAEQRKDHIQRFIDKKPKSTAPNIVLKFINFLQSDVYKKWFSADVDIPLTKHHILNIDVSSLYRKSVEIRLIIGIYLMRIVRTLDEKPTIITINNCDFLFEMETFAPHIGDWLINVTKMNAITLLATSNVDMVSNNQYYEKNLTAFATQIFMGNRLTDTRLKYVLNLSESEFVKLKSYDRSYRAFMLRHGNQSLFSSFDLSKAPELLKMIG